jgi:hypothetical protein
MLKLSGFIINAMTIDDIIIFHTFTSTCPVTLTLSTFLWNMSKTDIAEKTKMRNWMSVKWNGGRAITINIINFWEHWWRLQCTCWTTYMIKVDPLISKCVMLHGAQVCAQSGAYVCISWHPPPHTLPSSENTLSNSFVCWKSFENNWDLLHGMQPPTQWHAEVGFFGCCKYRVRRQRWQEMWADEKHLSQKIRRGWCETNKEEIQ